MAQSLVSPTEPSPAKEVPTSAPKKRRRLPRFGLRAAFVVAILSCLFFAWVRANYLRMREEEAAIEALLAANAGIVSDDPVIFMGTAAQRAAAGLEPPLPTFGERVGRSLGLTPPLRVDRVLLRGDDPADPKLAPALAALRRFPHLWLVELQGPAFDDRAMRELAEVPSLMTLSLYDTSVSGDGLTALASHESLHTISISHDPTGDLGRGVARLKNLTTVLLSNVPIDREDVEALAAFPNLRQLTLTLVSFADRSDLLIPLGQSESLEHLIVRAEGIDHGAVIELPAPPQLRTLEIEGLTIANLPPYPKLESLDAEGIKDEMLAAWPVPRGLQSATFYPPVTKQGLRPVAAVAAQWHCQIDYRPEGKP